MNADQNIWWVWANAIRRWGMEEWVASFLDAAGPLTVLGAQAVYIGQPLLEHVLPGSHLNALARLLEDTTQTQAFTTLLREESAS